MKQVKTNNHEGSFFGLDKMQHILLYALITLILCKWCSYWLSFVICFTIGLLVEILETTDLWTWIMHKMGENESKSPISYKDLVVNVVASICAIVVNWSLK